MRTDALAVVLAGLCAFVGVVVAVAVWGVTTPTVPDEFGYLLGADTFLEGRLANPPHPYWTHFEAASAISQPTYSSKFPPGQSALLAFGSVVGTSPYVGVWLGVAFLAASVCWMLRGWVPTAWAFGGGAGAGLVWGSLTYWGHSFWGGALAATGGALVFGAVPRLRRPPRAGHPAILHAVIFACGLGLLAFTRPFEGAVVSVVAVGTLAWGGWKHSDPRGLLRRTVLPMAPVLALIATFWLLYNQATTGDPWTMAHLAHERAYLGTPHLSILPSVGIPEHRHEILQRGARWQADLWATMQTFDGWRHSMSLRAGRLFDFALGPVLVLPLLLVPWTLRRPGTALALAAWAVYLVTQAVVVSFYPHYAAPVLPLLALLVVQGLRRAGDWLRRRPKGRALAPWLLGVFVIVAAGERILIHEDDALTAARANAPLFELREEVALHLEDAGGRHVVFVEYGSPRAYRWDWVVNGADIDAQRVVWARPLGPEADAELRRYYGDRHAWRARLDFDGTVFELLPWEPSRSATSCYDPPPRPAPTFLGPPSFPLAPFPRRSS